jgi:hypothetical protein
VRAIAKSDAKIMSELLDLESQLTPREIVFVASLLNFVSFGRLSVSRGLKSGLSSRISEFEHKTQKLTVCDYKALKYSPFVTHYVNSNNPSTVVVFTGLAGRMGFETWKFLASTYQSGVSFLVLHNKGTIEKGVQGLGNDPLTTLEALADLVDKKGIEVVATMGVSGGTLPALHFAYSSGLENALLVGPSNPETSKSWKLLLEQSSISEPDKVRGMMWVGDQAPHDITAAKKLMKLFPNLEMKLIAGGKHVPFEAMTIEEFSGGIEKLIGVKRKQGVDL